jgi:hypothetical protein
MIASSASAKPKAVKKKKKRAPAAVAVAPVAATPDTAPAAAPAPTPSGGTRNFTCEGRPNLQITWRDVSGTIDAKMNLTNVSVTQIWQKVNDALVERPTVVLTSPNPPGQQDPASPLLVYQLNQAPPATAADVNQLLTIYKLDLPNVQPPGPTFKAGLFFNTQKGVAGPVANEYKWSYVSSLAYSGLFEINCQYT